MAYGQGTLSIKLINRLYEVEHVCAGLVRVAVGQEKVRKKALIHGHVEVRNMVRKILNLSRSKNFILRLLQGLIMSF